MEKQETQSEYETETLHVPCSIRVAAWICTWTLTKANSGRLHTFHMKAQRRILNIK